MLYRIITIHDITSFTKNKHASKHYHVTYNVRHTTRRTTYDAYNVRRTMYRYWRPTPLSMVHVYLNIVMTIAIIVFFTNNEIYKLYVGLQKPGHNMTAIKIYV